MKISVVTTMYHSVPYINEFYERTVNVLQKITDDYEIVFVNDGSPDHSLELALKLYEKDIHVKIVNLSRNFGHHKAVMTGLSYAKGDYVFMIDIDLEEAPENIELFWNEINSDNYTDVVYGIQEKRKGGLFEQFSGDLFFKIFNFFSDTKVPPSFCFSRLAKRNYINALLKYQEHELFIGGIWYLVGFNQKGIVISKTSKGKSTYTFKKKISLSVNALTSFTNKPLKYIFITGSMITFFSLLCAIFFIIIKLIFGVPISGWASLFVSLWLIGGLIIFNLGVVSIYLSKIFTEVKNRPYTIVKDYYNSD